MHSRCSAGCLLGRVDQLAAEGQWLRTVVIPLHSDCVEMDARTGSRC
jgi:hypothetical protein